MWEVETFISGLAATERIRRTGASCFPVFNTRAEILGPSPVESVNNG